ncbi:50S ribosomal protein L30e [Candidatus Woesearchaeota archaeon]|nr:50S ribosomal protein L30e [Candidatus Woesearchaeota archaeon]
MDSIAEIKKALETKKAVIGTNRIIKSLKLGKLKQVFLTSNTPEEIKQTIKYYAKANKIKVVQLKQPNEELGTICKKPFAISVLGIKGD